eukprot:COSAG05_NODE_2505_length_2973_cov_1.820111_1_plen_312_part_00
MAAMPRSIKCVVVGDGAVGKTCMLVTYAEDRFPEEYLPTVFDNYAASLMVDGIPIQLELWDTAGQEEYDRVRPLSYPNTDIFLLVFSVASRASFVNIQTKWIPELLSQPLVDLSMSKVILVGCKTDLRTDQFAAASPEGSMVSPEEGQELARQIAATRYMECSAKTREGLKQVYDEAIRASLGLDASADIPPKGLGQKMSLTFGSIKGKIMDLSEDQVHDLADENVRKAKQPRLSVLKSGWMEKKGGLTAMLPDGTLHKERNLAKGGRRTWTRKFFVLLDNGVLLYYKEEAQTIASCNGHLQLGLGSEIQR